MAIFGLETIEGDLKQGGFFFKAILNESGALFFPGSAQHRDMKVSGISYEDDYVGNAVAVTFTPGRADIRYHKAFSDQRIGTVIQTLLYQPQMDWAKPFQIFYQGRPLKIR